MLLVPISLLCFIHINYSRQPVGRAGYTEKQRLSHICLLTPALAAPEKLPAMRLYILKNMHVNSSLFNYKERTFKKKEPIRNTVLLLVIYSNKYIHCCSSKKRTLRQQNSMYLSEENISQIYLCCNRHSRRIIKCFSFILYKPLFLHFCSNLYGFPSQISRRCMQN